MFTIQLFFKLDGKEIRKWKGNFFFVSSELIIRVKRNEFQR